LMMVHCFGGPQIFPNNSLQVVELIHDSDNLDHRLLPLL
jgi:hypothetical protein